MPSDFAPVRSVLTRERELGRSFAEAWALEHDVSPRWRVSAQVVKVSAHDSLGRAFEPLEATDQVDGLRLHASWPAGLRVDPQALLVGQLHGEAPVLPVRLWGRGSSTSASPKRSETDERMNSGLNASRGRL